MSTIEDTLNEIRSDLMVLPSVRMYEGVPEQLGEWPAVVVATMGGRSWLETHDGTIFTEHDVRVEIHVPRKNLGDASLGMTLLAEEAITLIYSGFVRDRYQDTMVTTGDPRGANNASAPLDYAIGPSEWGGTQTYAFMCDFKVTRETRVEL